ncbi:MAG TPA: glycosyltransferase family 87 protein [Sphingomonas sp.]|nr:glycosyltransferase family 87 protein [Sphingomonas sp.]
MTAWHRRIWIAGCALLIAVAAFQLVQVASGATAAASLAHRDFANLWTGGRLVAARDWATLYDRTAFTAQQAQWVGSFGPRIFSYPPTAFMLIVPFASLPYGFAFAAWLVATGTFFVVAAWRWWPAGAGSPWLALLMPAALFNAWLGHFGFVFGGLWLLAFALLPRHPAIAGLTIGLFAMKPQLAVLIPLLLLLRRDWHAIAAAAAGTGGIVLVSVALYGTAAWTAFLNGAVGTQAGFINAHGANFARLSTSAATAMFELGGSAALAFGAQALLALLGVGLVVQAARRGAGLDRLAPLAATATFLVLPYALSYDLTAVSVGALALMIDPAACRTERALGAIGFVAPQVGVIAALLGAPIMSLMLAGLAVGQFRAATDRAGRQVRA